MLRPTAAAAVSSRAISHPSASRQHSPAPQTTSARALTPLGWIHLLCCWPPPTSLGTREGEGLRLVTSKLWVLASPSSPTWLCLSPHPPQHRLGPGLGGRVVEDVAGTGEQGRGGGMGAGWWDGTGQPYVGRMVGHGEHPGGRLVCQGDPMAGQAGRRPGAGNGTGSACSMPGCLMGGWVCQVPAGISLPFLEQWLPFVSLLLFLGDHMGFPGTEKPWRKVAVMRNDTPHRTLPLATHPEGCPRAGGEALSCSAPRASGAEGGSRASFPQSCCCYKNDDHCLSPKSHPGAGSPCTLACPFPATLAVSLQLGLRPPGLGGCCVWGHCEAKDPGIPPPVSPQPTGVPAAEPLAIR